MISDDLLTRWTTPPTIDGPFLRPFVCRGHLVHHGVFIAGINPGTPIYPSDISPSEYRKILRSTEQFEPAYSAIRSKRGESADGRTRLGLRSLSNWFLAEGVKGLLETNVVPYPTRKARQLKNISIEHQSHWVFREVCETFRPKLIVLHGKPSRDKFIDYVAPKSLQWAKNVSMEELENRSEPLMVGKWSDNEPYFVFVCRHLMYYGICGDSYLPFRNAIKSYLTLDDHS